MSHANNDNVPERTFRKPDPAARRLRLRAYQSQLAERMQAARTGTRPQSSQLGVQIGNRRWLLNLREAGEIVALGMLTPVPLTQPWFLGLTNVRGNLISVIDLAQFLGDTPIITDKQSRIVAFAPSLAFNSAFLVTRLLGLHNVAEMTLQAGTTLPELAWVPRSYCDRDGQHWQVLDLAALIQDPQFLQVGA